MPVLTEADRDQAPFSSEIEIEHILPWSRTFDDSAANKVVCFRDENRIEAQKAPHEAFGSARNWQDIAANGPCPAKQQALALCTRCDGAVQNEERNFLARQLNETRHLSRMARIYLQRACHPDHVYVTTGQMTAMLRARWGLNSLLRDHNRRPEGWRRLGQTSKAPKAATTTVTTPSMPA